MQNRIAKKWTLILLVLLLSFTFSLLYTIAAIAEEEIPLLPAIYSGMVKDADGKPVPSGTVRAYIYNEPRGERTILDGRYADLVVQGNNAMYNLPVSFKVMIGNTEYQAVSEPTAVFWQSGKISGVDFPEVNLKVDYRSQGQPTEPSAGSNTPGGGGGPLPTGQLSLSVEPTTMSLLVGQAQQLRVILNPTTAAVTYASDNAKVAHVDAAGLVTAVGKGTAAITVTATKSSSNPVTVKVEVRVSEREVPSNTVVPFTTFTDLDGHWAQDTIQELVYKGIISGYPDHTFKPDNPITRAECAAIIVKALNYKDGDEAVLNSFKDSADIPQWARQALAAALKAGLLKGYPEKGGKLTLRAQNKITRQETAAVISRILAQEPHEHQTDEPAFSDSGSIPAWALDAVKEAAASGILSGYPDNTFRGARFITRAECAAVVKRLLNQ